MVRDAHPKEMRSMRPGEFRACDATVLACHRQFDRLIDPNLIEIVAGALAIDDKEALFVVENEQRVVPDVAGIIHALATGGLECTKARGYEWIGADQNEP